jgi:hypothetical protein
MMSFPMLDLIRIFQVVSILLQNIANHCCTISGNILIIKNNKDASPTHSGRTYGILVLICCEPQRIRIQTAHTHLFTSYDRTMKKLPWMGPFSTHLLNQSSFLNHPAFVIGKSHLLTAPCCRISIFWRFDCFWCHWRSLFQALVIFKSRRNFSLLPF